MTKRASAIERKFFFFIESIFGEDNVENTYSFITKDKKKIEKTHMKTLKVKK